MESSLSKQGGPLSEKSITVTHLEIWGSETVLQDFRIANFVKIYKKKVMYMTAGTIAVSHY